VTISYAYLFSSVIPNDLLKPRETFAYLFNSVIPDDLLNHEKYSCSVLRLHYVDIAILENI